MPWGPRTNESCRRVHGATRPFDGPDSIKRCGIVLPTDTAASRHRNPAGAYGHCRRFAKGVLDAENQWLCAAPSTRGEYDYCGPLSAIQGLREGRAVGAIGADIVARRTSDAEPRNRPTTKATVSASSSRVSRESGAHSNGAAVEARTNALAR